MRPGRPSLRGKKSSKTTCVYCRRSFGFPFSSVSASSFFLARVPLIRNGLIAPMKKSWPRSPPLTRGELRVLSWWLLLVLSTLARSFTLAAHTPSGLLELHYINVQQRGSTLVIGPDGTTILMDAGNNGKGRSEVVPYLMSIDLLPEDGLDYTIASHLDADHIAGFDEMVGHPEGYDVGFKNYFNGSDKTGATIDEYVEACSATMASGSETIPLGHVIELGDGAKLTVVAVGGTVTRHAAKRTPETAPADTRTERAGSRTAGTNSNVLWSD